MERRRCPDCGAEVRFMGGRLCPRCLHDTSAGRSLLDGDYEEVQRAWWKVDPAYACTAAALFVVVVALLIAGRSILAG